MTHALLITVLLMIVGLYMAPLIMWLYWAIEDRSNDSKKTAKPSHEPMGLSDHSLSAQESLQTSV